MKFDRKTTRHVMMISFSTVLFFFLLWNIGSCWKAVRSMIGLLMPVFIGFCIAFVLQPLVTAAEQPLLHWGERHLKNEKQRARWKPLCRIVGILCTLILLCGVMTLLVFTVFPEVRTTMQQFRHDLPEYIRHVRAWLHHLPAAFAFLENLPLEQIEIDWTEVAATLTDFLKNGAGSMLNGVVGATVSIIGGVWDAVFGMILAIYFLAQREQISRFIRRAMRAFLPDSKVRRVCHVGAVADDAFSSFVTGQLTEAVIIGLLCYLGMMIFRMPYAMTIGTVVGFTALIPVFGAWIGAIFGVLLILTVEPIQALWFIVFLVVLQQLEGDFIYPRVVGRSMGLPGLLVMLAVWIGGSLAGIPGMLFSVPLCSMLYTLVKEAIDVRLKQKDAAVVASGEAPDV